MTARVGYFPDTTGITRPQRLLASPQRLYPEWDNLGCAVPTEGSCRVLRPHRLPQNYSLKEVGTKGTLVIEAPECQEGLGWC